MIPSIAGQVTDCRLCAVHLEHLLEATHVVPRLAEMRLESRAQLRRGRLADHVRQRADDALLGVVDVLQLMDEQIVHRL